MSELKCPNCGQTKFIAFIGGIGSKSENTIKTRTKYHCGSCRESFEIEDGTSKIIVTKTNNGILGHDEKHPAVVLAVNYLKTISDKEIVQIEHALSTNAIESNPLAEVALETLRRIKANEDISDRFVLGFAWIVRDMREMAKEKLEISTTKEKVN